MSVPALGPTDVDERSTGLPVSEPPASHDGTNLNVGKGRFMPPSPYYGDDWRILFVNLLGEFCGTYMFLLFAEVICQIANSTAQALQISNAASLIMISFGFGFSVMVNIYIFYRISGGHLNPSVTLSCAIAGVCPPIKCALYCCIQIIAGIAAAATASALTPGPVRFDNELSGGCSKSRGLFIEMFGVMPLHLSVLFTAVEKSKITFMAPYVIGIALFIGHLFAVFYTGAGLNPARSLGPAIMKTYFPGYHWIYWIGPLIASVITGLFYRLMKWIDYETANPGQDSEY